MGDVYRVIAPPPLLFAAGLAVGILLDGLLTDSDLAGAAPLVVGALLVAAGVALQVGFLRMFQRSRTAILPGREASALVTSGLYRVSRNPGYLGMALAAAGIAILLDAPWALLTVVLTILVVDRGVIAREERYLTERFGDEYRAYCARVRRWI
jgi:protein-S-isoprenylcysteine O-methyltransferase Ste14